MKTSGILSATVLLVLLVGGQSAAADGWSLEKLNDDMKKFNQGTKKFFISTVDALSWWKEPAAKKKPSRPHLSWIREPKHRQYPRGPKKQQKSWWESLFRREKPKRVDSMKDWVGLPKPDM